MKDIVKTVLLVAAIVLSVVAIAVSVTTLIGFTSFQRAGLAAVQEARAGLGDLTGFTIETSVPVQQTFPIYAEVPFRQDFAVPIRTEIPISTVVEVPINVPIFGTYTLEVPVDTTVPIDLQLVIPVSQTVTVETSVTLDTEIPVRLELSQLGIDDLLDQVDQALAELEAGFQWFWGSER
ncbi:MAG: hypothetical protein JXD18_15430 [Anaerolineae bacterium]|nr:hypothetical protein [Anaerolineae bacterium]